jgi:diacylglycerol kinase family enzyme
MRVIVITNAGAGTRGNAAEDPSSIASAFSAAGVEADIRPTPGEGLTAAMRRAIDDARQGAADAVVAAGGDGTVSAAAAVLAGTNIPLGVLPLGTLNHFAKDLGIPPTLAEAAKVIAVGNVRAVDVGEVTAMEPASGAGVSRTFINNASIGLYPHMVSKRERQQERLGRGKWVAMLAALLSVFRRYPVIEVILNTPHLAMRRKTPFVFVGNNRYRFDLLRPGGRPALDGGELGVYLANRTGRFGLVRMAFRALLGRLEQARDFDALASPELEVATRKKTLRIALDGEVTRLRPPLHFRSRAGALRVLAPGGQVVE